AWDQERDLEQARTYAELGLKLFREVGFKGTSGAAFIAEVELEAGNLARAERFYEAILVLMQEHLPNEMPALTRALGCLANINLVRGLFERAATLLGAVEACALGRIDYNPYSRWKVRYFSDIETVLAQLGERAFEKAWAKGKAMTREQAILYALEEQAG